MDVRQAFGNVSPQSLSLVMKEIGIAPMLASAILREQMGGTSDICFLETRVCGVPFDKSIKQGGKESSCLFNVMMRSVLKPQHEEWNDMRMGVRMRNSEGQQEECRVGHKIVADNCYLFAASKKKKSGR